VAEQDGAPGGLPLEQRVEAGVQEDRGQGGQVDDVLELAQARLVEMPDQDQETTRAPRMSTVLRSVREPTPAAWRAAGAPSAGTSCKLAKW